MSSMNGSKSNVSLLQLCRWMLRYPWRRWLPLAAVVGTMLLKIGLDVLKPWPMVFLIDYALKGEIMPAGLRQFVAALSGARTPLNLVGWSIAATVIIFLLSWAIGLANSYANISLGQRMIYDLAAELFAKLQQLSLHFHLRRSVGDIVRRVAADCTCVSVIVEDALLPVCFSLISLAVMFTIMWRIDATLTMLALAVAPCMMIVFRFCAQPMMDRSYAE